jgi:hypothetical protein
MGAKADLAAKLLPSLKRRNSGAEISFAPALFAYSRRGCLPRSRAHAVLARRDDYAVRRSYRAQQAP